MNNVYLFVWKFRSLRKVYPTCLTPSIVTSALPRILTTLSHADFGVILTTVTIHDCCLYSFCYDFSSLFHAH